MRVPVVDTLQRSLKPWRRQLGAWWLTRQGRREDAVVLHSRAIPGMFRQEEIRLLYRTVRATEGPGEIAEIGSWKGRTSVVMGLALRDMGETGTRIYAIDHHMGSEEHRDRIEREGSTLQAFRRNIRRAGVADLIEEMVMDSEAASRVLAERQIQLRMVFIDGAHDEASVRRDIELFVPLVRPKGIVALHDCAPDCGFDDVWKVYRSDLAPRVTELGRAYSLTVTQLKA